MDSVLMLCKRYKISYLEENFFNNYLESLFSKDESKISRFLSSFSTQEFSKKDLIDRFLNSVRNETLVTNAPQIMKKRDSFIRIYYEIIK